MKGGCGAAGKGRAIRAADHPRESCARDRHPLLCAPDTAANPRAIIPDADDIAEQMEEHRREGDPVPLILAFSAADKAAADAPLGASAEYSGFVPYLRNALR